MKSTSALLLLATLCSTSALAQETVTIHSGTTYQTIDAWGAPPTGWLDPVLWGPLVEEYVHSLGMNRIRLEPERRDWEDVLNDNTDPFLAVPTAFGTAQRDNLLNGIILPMKTAVERRGEHFSLYVSPSFYDSGSTGTAPAWLLNSPGEYAEFGIEYLQRLRKDYNVIPDGYVICNEAQNNNAFTATVVAGMIKAIGPRMEAMGLRTTIQWPECVNGNTSWTHITSTGTTNEDVLRWVGSLSYHVYGPYDNRDKIAAFAATRGLPTIQSEYMGVNINLLYNDLVLGNVSTWETYAVGDLMPFVNNATSKWFTRSQAYWHLRQVFKFIRPGSVRVGVSSSNANLRALAFIRSGTTALVLINTSDSTARTVNIAGLTPGTYAQTQTVGNSAASELGLVTVSPAGTHTVNLSGTCVYTIYPRGGNLAPSLTNYRSTPEFLTLPTASATLTASATDPELEPVSYLWSVLGKPAGATVTLSGSNSTSCTASGMSVAGEYLFGITISDGTNSLLRKLPVSVYASNRPPVIKDLHNRLPVTVVLPASSTVLRVFAQDINSDPITYQWSVLSQPNGANAVIAGATATSATASQMTVAGDYVFRAVATAGGQSDAKDLTVKVYPADVPPVITSATASPSLVPVPASSSTLSASTSDPDGYTISHWWSVQSAPTGASPVFANPGAASTSVTGLIVPGTYKFRLTLVDRASFTTTGISGSPADVTVTVTGSGASRTSLVSPNGGETYRASQYHVWIRWGSYNVAGNVKLEWFDGSGWHTITASTPNDGAERWVLPRGNYSGCKVRISEAGGGASDESDQTFSISLDTPRIDEFTIDENGDVRIEFEQQPEEPNVVERSFTLAPGDWQVLGTFDGEAQNAWFNDSGAASRPKAFYRIRN